MDPYFMLAQNLSRPYNYLKFLEGEDGEEENTCDPTDDFAIWPGTNQGSLEYFAPRPTRPNPKLTVIYSFWKLGHVPILL